MITFAHNPMKRRHAISQIRRRIANGPRSFEGLRRLVAGLDRVKRVRLPGGKRRLLYSVIVAVEKTQENVARIREQRHVWRSSDFEDGVQKYCGVLNQAQFDRLVQNFYLGAEQTQTLGMIGAPGFGLMSTPAISFKGEAFEIAYVFPFVVAGRGKKQRLVPFDWPKMRAAIIQKYPL